MRLGLGTFGFGGELKRDLRFFAEDVEFLKRAMEYGFDFFDTAENYGCGGSEMALGRALEFFSKKEIRIASKFSPENNSSKGMVKSAEKSLERLGVDTIFLYQMHWPNPKIDLDEIFEGFHRLLGSGKIQSVGLCNSPAADVSRLHKEFGSKCRVFSQIEANLDNLVQLNLCNNSQDLEQVTVICYSPLGHGKIADNQIGEAVMEVAEAHDCDWSSIALTWLLQQRENLIVIPKTTKFNRLKYFKKSVEIQLTPRQCELLSSLCITDISEISIHDIVLEDGGLGNRMVYKTESEALKNTLGLNPSPLDLATSLRNGGVIDPIKLVMMNDGKYKLVEGRLKYWAWVLAFGYSSKIKALVLKG